MLDLSRVKRKEKITIVQQDRYPNQAVITALAVVDKKRPTIKLNRRAMESLGVTETNNRLILFPEYNISQTNEAEYDTIIGVVSDAIVKTESKQHKTYQIHLNTRCVKSTNIHNAICELFDLSQSKTHDFEISPCAGVPGAFTLSYIEDSNEDDTVEVEVEFDKGAEVAIEEA